MRAWLAVLPFVVVCVSALMFHFSALMVTFLKTEYRLKIKEYRGNLEKLSRSKP